jgi:hypothetical protein
MIIIRNATSLMRVGRSAQAKHHRLGWPYWEDQLEMKQMSLVPTALTMSQRAPRSATGHPYA